MQISFLISLWIHVIAAMVWLGGTIFLVIVVAPILRRLDDRKAASDLVRRAGNRFRPIGWACFALLAATGIYNLSHLGVRLEDVRNLRFWNDPFGHTLAVKLAIFGVIVLFSLVHDFVVGPRARVRPGEDPGSPRILRYRRLTAWMGRVNLVFGLAVIVMAILLVHGSPW